MQAKSLSLSVDVGSGGTKAVSSEGERITFPSVLAPAREDDLDGIFKMSGVGHRLSVSYTCPDGDGERKDWLVGDMATKSPMAMLSLSYEKEPDFHDAMLMTAAYILGAGSSDFSGPVSLALGVPLAVYKKGKQALKSRLQDLSAKVRVNGCEERVIPLNRVEVYPQGAGVVMALMGKLPEGLNGIIDIGKYTTDEMLVEVKNGIPRVLGDEYRASHPHGTHLVDRAMMAEFRKVTGLPLELVDSSETTMKALAGRPLVFDGKEIYLREALMKAIKDTAMTIHQGVISTWGALSRQLVNVSLAGGGALLFERSLAAVLPSVHVVEEPVYANALGFLEAISG